MKRKTKNSIIIGVFFVIVMILLIVLNIRLVFNVTSSQTEKLGSVQMESISKQLEKNLNDAEKTVINVAYEADLAIAKGATQEELNTYISTEKKKLQSGSCINVYAAGKNWYIIPDFDAPEGFVATDRLWYTGAIKNKGDVYITQPYMDLASDSVCFTVSKVLSDGVTVVCIDYNLNEIQTYIQELDSGGTAIIVAESGEIAGYKDSSLLGKNIKDSLSEYQDIFELEKNNPNMVVLTKRINNRTKTIFCSKTANNWYLMLCVDNSALYSSSYRQVIWISVVNGALLLAMLILYAYTSRQEQKLEKELDDQMEVINGVKNDLAIPIRRIANYSSADNLSDYEMKEESLRSIRQIATQMSSIVDSIGTASMKSAKAVEKSIKKATNIGATNRKIRVAIITVIFAAMCISVTLVGTSNANLGKERMHEEADYYENELAGWVNEQKSILGMFCNTISADPSILDNYEEACDFLNDITVQYEDISVTYMTNPAAEHTVIMNNRWEPDADWHVEERQWYIDTLNSKNGFSISSPYYDEQTGIYCVTFSQIVYDKDNTFLGIFGIDFYMDKLTQILGQSYNSTGYAFLVDANGNIINHPNAYYQMNESTATNVFNVEYKNIYANNEVTRNVRDYDGKLKTCISKQDSASGFTVIIVKDWWSMFGSIILYSLLFVLMFGGCIAAIYYLISKLIIWQNEVNAQLKDAAEKATSAGKAKSRFLAQMSHEIRTPINAVLGMNELIMRETSDSTIRDYSNDIQSAGKTLLSLINSILDFSKIEDGKMEIVPVQYDAASMINDLVNMTSERSKSKNLEFKLDIDPRIPAFMYGDDVRLRQVIINLLTNAVKYTEAGSVTLRMNVREVEESTVQLYVSVSDTGIGIKEEDRDKLCLSFSRLDQERNHAIEGTGLGLSIVTKLLNMMDSELQIESEYGKGSNFFFIVQQGIVKNEPIGDYSAKRKYVLENENKKTLYAPNAAILAVDDNDMNLKVVRGLLRKNGIVPDIASSGFQCIELVEKKHYDIILLDHMMPVMDGIETLKKLQEMKLIDESTVVIVLTANAIVGAKEMYLEAGFRDYLSKPIDSNHLEEKLTEYLPVDKIQTNDNPEAALNNEVKKEEPKKEEPVEGIAEEASSLIDMNSGLAYCADDIDMYYEIVEAYLEEGESNIEKLDSFYDKQDWKNYSIIAHAVKSTSKTIGAVSLSEIAYKHEMAGKANDADTIDQSYLDFLSLYQRVLDEVKNMLEQHKN